MGDRRLREVYCRLPSRCNRVYRGFFSVMASASPPRVPPRSAVDGDFCGFVRQHVCAPLAAASHTGPLDLRRQHLPNLKRLRVPEALRSREVVSACRRQLQNMLAVAGAWSVQEPAPRDTMVVLARAPAAVSAAVMAVALAAGHLFRDALPLRDAVAAAMAAAITQYLRSDEHPLREGLPAVALRRRLQCRHVGFGVLELQFPAPLAELKAALVPADADVLVKLKAFVVSRIASCAVDRDGEPGFLPHSIVAGVGATARLLSSVGVPDSAFPVPLKWTAEDFALRTVGDFTSCVDATSGKSRPLVPLSLLSMPGRFTFSVFSLCRRCGAAEPDIEDLVTALRDDVAVAIWTFLKSAESAARVSLASRLAVVPCAMPGGLALAFAGDVAALMRALEHVSRPAAMSVHDEMVARRSLGAFPPPYDADMDADDTDPHDATMALCDLGISMYEQGDFEEAERLHRESLAVRRRRYGDDASHCHIAASLNNLALALQEQGSVKMVEAMRLHREALTMRRRLHGVGVDHADVAASLTNLANAKHACGELTEATPLYRESLAILRRINAHCAAADRDEAAVASALNNLGVVLRAQGMLSESAKLHREALATRRRVYGAHRDHPDVAGSLSNLSGVLQQQGELVETEALLRQSLAMRRRLFGAGDHNDVAASLTNLACLLQEGGAAHQREAAALHREALTMLRRLHGGDVDRRDVAAILGNLSEVLRTQGDFAAAATLQHESLAMRRRLFGVRTDHHEVAISLNCLACLLHVQGDLEGSARAHRETLAMRRRLHGVGPGAAHPDVATSLWYLARVLHAQSNLRESAKLHREAWVMRRRVHGADSTHPDVASSVNSLAGVLLAQGNLPESARLYRELLTMWRARNGAATNHHDAAATLSNLAAVLQEQGELTESARLQRESLAMMQRLFGIRADRRDVASSLYYLAEIARSQGELSESERLHRESLAMRRRLHGVEAAHSDVLRSLCRLATVMQAQGDVVDAERLRCDALAVKLRLYGDGVAPAVPAQGANDAADSDAEAVRLQRSALATAHRLHLTDAAHAMVAAALSNLGLVLTQVRWPGDMAEAAHSHTEALATWRRLHGADADHADVAAALSSLATVLEAQGDYPRADRALRNALTMKRRLGTISAHERRMLPDLETSEGPPLK
jgi:tetratricopeptide (TPR) repeat protein